MEIVIQNMNITFKKREPVTVKSLEVPYAGRDVYGNARAILFSNYLSMQKITKVSVGVWNAGPVLLYAFIPSNPNWVNNAKGDVHYTDAEGTYKYLSTLDAAVEGKNEFNVNISLPQGCKGIIVVKQGNPSFRTANNSVLVDEEDWMTGPTTSLAQVNSTLFDGNDVVIDKSITGATFYTGINNFSYIIIEGLD